ncbi:serine/threonine-protein kinase Pim-3 [Capsaspora owczarzaki ATCC 30864]|uniref:CAMK protein kinase n=1 Tax=Capsaspora owczarzaki (strain ATCC 30864) TaxID=595528 RepID=A0A0D2WII3_CAPO3|nr:serine/threonine-protein kinase Pim-3 [Capsaspora owczarzaki ATCC 30864]KJE88858.1 CAMK protein kinase [Capsaspora owczarzaki ATCC 30864]|eukprot:XP_004365304.2 serine/threonine-protein kinase Pim-3 [Capsaspora owczarzaki ATCC 30864]
MVASPERTAPPSSSSSPSLDQQSPSQLEQQRQPASPAKSFSQTTTSNRSPPPPPPQSSSNSIHHSSSSISSSSNINSSHSHSPSSSSAVVGRSSSSSSGGEPGPLLRSNSATTAPAMPSDAASPLLWTSSSASSFYTVPPSPLTLAGTDRPSLSTQASSSTLCSNSSSGLSTPTSVAPMFAAPDAPAVIDRSPSSSTQAEGSNEAATGQPAATNGADHDETHPSSDPPRSSKESDSLSLSLSLSSSSSSRVATASVSASSNGNHNHSHSHDSHNTSSAAGVSGDQQQKQHSTATQDNELTTTTATTALTTSSTTTTSTSTSTNTSISNIISTTAPATGATPIPTALPALADDSTGDKANNPVAAAEAGFAFAFASLSSASSGQDTLAEIIASTESPETPRVMAHGGMESSGARFPAFAQNGPRLSDTPPISPAVARVLSSPESVQQPALGTPSQPAAAQTANNTSSASTFASLPISGSPLHSSAPGSSSGSPVASPSSMRRTFVKRASSLLRPLSQHLPIFLADKNAPAGVGAGLPPPLVLVQDPATAPHTIVTTSASASASASATSAPSSPPTEHGPVLGSEDAPPVSSNISSASAISTTNTITPGAAATSTAVTAAALGVAKPAPLANAPVRGGRRLRRLMSVSSLAQMIRSLRIPSSRTASSSSSPHSSVPQSPLLPPATSPFSSSQLDDELENALRVDGSLGAEASGTEQVAAATTASPPTAAATAAAATSSTLLAAAATRLSSKRRSDVPQSAAAAQAIAAAIAAKGPDSDSDDEEDVPAPSPSTIRRRFSFSFKKNVSAATQPRSNSTVFSPSGMVPAATASAASGSLSNGATPSLSKNSSVADVSAPLKSARKSQNPPTPPKAGDGSSENIPAATENTSPPIPRGVKFSADLLRAGSSDSASTSTAGSSSDLSDGVSQPGGIPFQPETRQKSSLLQSMVSRRRRHTIGTSVGLRPDTCPVKKIRRYAKFIKEYRLGDQQLGNGAFGYVRTAIRKSDGHTFAVKVILKAKVLNWFDDQRLGRVPSEISALSRANENGGHPGVIGIHDAFESEDVYLIVLELPSGSILDLFEFIESTRRLGDSRETFIIFKQALDAIEFLHQRGIVHRDIKDENILLNSRTLRVKLIDFGSAIVLDPLSAPGATGPRATINTFLGTREYAAPEHVYRLDHDPYVAEIWALGALLYTTVFANPPFRDEHATVDAPVVFPLPISDHLRHLISWMLEKKPEDRPTVAQIQQHPWLTEYGKTVKIVFDDI